MEWPLIFGPDRKPDEKEIEDFIHSPLWADLNDFLRQNYLVEPAYSYSACSGQPGWNVKYQKAGRSLCTLYPMPGYFIALVVVGARELEEAEHRLPGFSRYTRELFASTQVSAGGRWLMINVRDEDILDDVKALIQIRRKLKKKG